MFRFDLIHIFPVRLQRFYLGCSVAIVMLFSSTFSIAQNEIQPENTVEINTKAVIRTKREMVVAAHPLAAQNGADILKSGTAIDAMVVVQMVLNLVEPQSSGIGGGAFLLFHDAQQFALISLDGREVAPSGS